MKKVWVVMLVLGLAVSQCGCLAAAVGYAAYEMSDAKKETAKTEARAKDLETYAKYRVDMEKINLEREKAGLKPNRIMTEDEWRSAQTTSPVMIEPKAEAPEEQK